MKAVILAAGKSTRTEPLTLTRPKPLLKAMNKTIIEHNLEQLKGIVDEAIIIVGYKKEMIIEKLGNSYKGIKISYVEQKQQLGTGHALLQAKKFFSPSNLANNDENGSKELNSDEKLIVINSDDFYSANDIKKLKEKTNGALAFEKEGVEDYGIFLVENNNVKGFIEKQKKIKKALCNTGCYIFSSGIVGILETLKKSPRGEYELTDAIKELIRQNAFSIVEIQGYWLPVSYAWQLLDANSYFIENLKSSVIKGHISDKATINGNIILGEGSIIKPGVVIEGNVVIGENSVIGPNCYLRQGTCIGNNCKIGQAVEIKNSIVMDNTNVPHLSYVGDSIIGENSNLGAGTITANLRHDNANIKSMVKGKLIDTQRRKLGAIIADDVHTGINTSIYPGRKLWPGTTTRPGEIVKKDIVKEETKNGNCKKDS